MFLDFLSVQAAFERRHKRTLKGSLHLTRPVLLLDRERRLGEREKKKFLQKRWSADSAFAWLVFSCFVGEKDIKYSLICFAGAIYCPTWMLNVPIYLNKTSAQYLLIFCIVSVSFPNSLFQYFCVVAIHALNWLVLNKCKWISFLNSENVLKQNLAAFEPLRLAGAV